MEYLSHNEAETEALGARLAAALTPGAVVAYRGGVCAVEWSEQVAEAMPPETVYVTISRRPEDDRARTITIEGVELQ